MIATSVDAFGAIGRLLEYPGAGYRTHLTQCLECLADGNPEALARIRRFAAAIDGLSVQQLQERFTETFDLNPVCTLEVGWQLFGEEYARGNFLVTMRQLLRTHEVPESSELPDHLTHVLSLLDRLESEARVELVERYVSPAVAKMLTSFEGKDGPYEDVMQAVGTLIADVTTAQTAEVAHD